MSKREIVGELAKSRSVERMIENIAHRSLDANLKDLSQMVYIILLEYDEDKIQDLYEHNQMNYFLARIIINQYQSCNSPFYKEFRKFGRMVDEEISICMNCHKEKFEAIESEKVLKDE